MKTIDYNTVELNRSEIEASKRFDHWLDEGANCYEALGRILVIDELSVSPRLAYWLACGGNRSKFRSTPRAINPELQAR
jgi:hypothetical protein